MKKNMKAGRAAAIMQDMKARMAAAQAVDVAAAQAAIVKDMKAGRAAAKKQCRPPTCREFFGGFLDSHGSGDRGNF